MTKRICAEPGCPNITNRPGYCQQHRRESPTYLQRDWAERQRRAKAVHDWRQAHGDWCPGYQRPPHPATDLTADHITPVNQGGITGPLQVYCRPCNSRRGDHPRGGEGG